MPYSFARRFSRQPSYLSPQFAAGETGVRIHAEGLMHDDGALAVPFYATVRLPQQEYASFSRVTEAVVLVVEDIVLRSNEVVPLVDPTLIPYDAVEPNFRVGSTWGNPDAICSEYVSFVLNLTVPPGPPGARLVLRANLLGHVSNTLVIDVEDVSATSYWKGVPHAVELAHLR